jgi:hypothetical protein
LDKSNFTKNFDLDSKIKFSDLLVLPDLLVLSKILTSPDLPKVLVLLKILRF